MSKLPKILLVSDISGEGPDYHVGDEAMAEVAIARLAARLPVENLRMGCASPEGVPATYGIGSVAIRNTTDARRRQLLITRPWSWLKGELQLRRALRWCDAVFICGGGNLTSVWPEVLESRLHLIDSALRARKRVILVSQTLGPFDQKHRDLARSLLSQVEFVGVRDPEFSGRQLGVECHFAVDDAVFLQPKHSDQTQALSQDGRSLVGLSLRSRGGVEPAKLRQVCFSVERLARTIRAQTVFFVHHAPKGRGDLLLARTVQDVWSESDPMCILDPIPRASAMKALTAGCDWVATMRYHQLLFALATGVPAIGIYIDEYSHAKLQGAFLQFGLEPRVVHLDDAAVRLEDMVGIVRAERARFMEAARTVAENALPDSLRPYQLVLGNAPTKPGSDAPRTSP